MNKEINQVENIMIVIGTIMFAGVGLFVLFMLGWWISYHIQLTLKMLGLTFAWAAFMIWKQSRGT